MDILTLVRYTRVLLKNLLIEREQYYLDNLKPEYNILKIANSRLGSKQSEQLK